MAQPKNVRLVTEQALENAFQGVIDAGADVDTYGRRVHVGTWRVNPGTYASLPVVIEDPATLEVAVTDVAYTDVQTLTTTAGQWWRKSIGSTGSTITWDVWRQVADAADVGPSFAARQVLDLARADGWHALFDPTNPETRSLRYGRVHEIRDGLGNFPALKAQVAGAQPGFARGGFGQLDAGIYGDGGVARALRTAGLSTPLAQPTFILALVKSETTTPGSQYRFVVDGALASGRQSIHWTTAGAQSWAMYANGEMNSFSTTMDTDTHVVGALFNGPAGSGLWIDGDESGKTFTGGTFTNPLDGLTVGNHQAGGSGRHWLGKIGAVLVYDGIPTDEVRDRMTNLLRSLSEPSGLVTDNLNSVSAIMTESDGSVVYGKAPDSPQIPASTIKTLTAWMVRQTITDARLDELVTCQDSDGLTGSSPRLYHGDQISYRDLLYLLMLPSHNVAAKILARAVGSQLAGAEAAVTKFMNAMQATVNGWGWTGAVCVEPSGLSTGNRLTARMLAEHMHRIATQDSVLLGIMGVMQRDCVVTGPKPRTVVAKHTFKVTGEVAFPEFVAGKTGGLTLSNVTLGNLVFLVTKPGGGYRAVVTLRANPLDARYPDARRVLDGTATVKRSAGMVVTDSAGAQALDDPGSQMRSRMDALYAPRSSASGIVDISSRTPGADISAAGAGVWVQRRGDMVELTLAAVKLTGATTIANAIPDGFKPAAAFAYGQRIRVTGSGTFEAPGVAASEVLRETLVWLTGDPHPAPADS